ncbi:hypothetical protein [Enterococcus faecalis]|uniref:hypothetical protein n=1 Tax=Enterococcus faecalis TaxID=1351 RepID=UPI001E340A7D|nr:hypothetical protein [Enterococcus faecalis]MCD5032942.1 hypothetical protein [Enterococcus faecalis]
MKLNKYFLATSALVLNTLVAPIATVAQSSQDIFTTPESAEKVISQDSLLEENPLLNQETISSSEQAITEESHTNDSSEISYETG